MYKILVKSSEKLNHPSCCSEYLKWESTFMQALYEKSDKNKL